MNHARHIGRVGALAVTFGVGAALLTTPALGYAETPDSDSPNNSSQPTDPATGNPDTDSPDAATPDPADSDPAESPAGDELSEPAESDEDTDAGVRSVDEKDAKAAPRTGGRHSATPRPGRRVLDALTPGPADVSDALDSLSDAISAVRDQPVRSAVTRLAATVAAPDRIVSARAVQVEPLSAAVTAEPTTQTARTVVTQLAAAILGPLLTPTNPDAPGTAPLLWAVLAVARRQFDSPGLEGSPAQIVAAATERNWFAREFDAATPTFPDQAVTEALNKGQVSNPFALGGQDTDGRALTYTIDGKSTGTGTAGGTLTITDGNATYTPPSDWDGTSVRTDTFTVTASDRPGNFPHLHGISGLIHVLSFGLIGESGHTATGKLTVTLAPYAAATFPITMVNDSGGKYADSDIYITVLGQTSKDEWAWVDKDGVAHHINHLDANAPGHLTKDGVNYANMSFTLDQAGGLRIPPEYQGARVFVSIDQPLYIGIAADDSGWSGLEPDNANDPNYETVYDWYEFTYQYGGVAFGGNMSQVDQFGLPLRFTLTQASSGFNQTRGTVAGVTRDEMFAQYKAAVPDAFDGLVVYAEDGITPLRIVSPRTAQPGALATYLDPAVNQFWSTYTNGNTFTFTSPGAYTVTGQVVSNQFKYHVEALSPDGVSGDFVMAKPTTAQVFAGNGPFEGTHEQGAFLAQLDAAFNRGVALTPANWGTVSTYYPSSTPYNAYAKFFHNPAVSVDGFAYGFPYDDVNSQSSVLILNNANPPDNVYIYVQG